SCVSKCESNLYGSRLPPPPLLPIDSELVSCNLILVTVLHGGGISRAIRRIGVISVAIAERSADIK
ncbi:MAG: hypothetical protein ABI970_09990, partial [Chloroflexota bacterium]